MVDEVQGLIPMPTKYYLDLNTSKRKKPYSRDLKYFKRTNSIFLVLHTISVKISNTVSQMGVLF